MEDPPKPANFGKTSNSEGPARAPIGGGGGASSDAGSNKDGEDRANFPPGSKERREIIKEMHAHAYGIVREMQKAGIAPAVIGPAAPDRPQSRLFLQESFLGVKKQSGTQQSVAEETDKIQHVRAAAKTFGGGTPLSKKTKPLPPDNAAVAAAMAQPAYVRRGLRRKFLRFFQNKAKSPLPRWWPWPKDARRQQVLGGQRPDLLYAMLCAAGAGGGSLVYELSAGAQVSGHSSEHGVWPKVPGGVAPPVPQGQLDLGKIQSEVAARTRGLNREDAKGVEQSCAKEEAKGFLGQPTPIADLPPDHFAMFRFPLKQQKEDGSIKTRYCDDGTLSGVNAAFKTDTPVRLDSIDDAVSLVEVVAALGLKPNMLTTDHEEAYKQMLAFLANVYVYSWCPVRGLVGRQANTLLFGEAGAVTAYNLLSAVIKCISRRFLWLLTLAFYDDFFAVEDEGEIVGAKDDFLALFSGVLGFKFGPHKTSFGPCLKFLGVMFNVEPAEGGAGQIALRLWLTANRVKKITTQILGALARDALGPTAAGKLAGLLSWAQCVLFRKCGRAALQPIYDRTYARGRGPWAIGKSLSLALGWWVSVLRSQTFATVVRLGKARRAMDVSLVYSDASFKGLGGVCFRFPAGEPDWPRVEFFATALPPGLEGRLHIQLLESAAAAMATVHWTPPEQPSDVVSFIDNTGTQGCFRRGTGSSPAENEIIGGTWAHLCAAQSSMWEERVGSVANIADLPSRLEIAELLRCLQILFPGCKPKRVFPGAGDLPKLLR
eukprot:gene58-387_t